MIDQDKDVIVCSLMGMGKKHLCRRFNEKACILCQLKNKYNNLYSMIVNNLQITYAKEQGVEGLTIVLTPRKGLSVQHKDAITAKLVELYAVREVIYDLECDI